MPATRHTIDPYAVLGVPRDASALQVARAHRRLAKRHHPDLHHAAGDATDAAEQMRRINEAWSILSNPVQRADYDRAHPVAGSRAVGSRVPPPPGAHWTPPRPVVVPRSPATTRTWATWRATAADTRAAPRTQRQPGEVPVIRTRRPPRAEAKEAGFLESGWAALLAAGAILLLLAGAVVAGRLAF